MLRHTAGNGIPLRAIRELARNLREAVDVFMSLAALSIAIHAKGARRKPIVHFDQRPTGRGHELCFYFSS